MTPIVEVWSDGRHITRSFLALSHNPAAVGDNLQAVWYRQPDLANAIWEAETWVAGDIAQAVKTVKWQLGISDTYDDRWPVASLLVDMATTSDPVEYSNGFPADDPLGIAINGALNRNELVDILTEWGYPVANMPYERMDSNGQIKIVNVLLTLAATVDEFEWRMLAQPVPGAPVPVLPLNWPPGVLPLPGVPVPTPATPIPAVVPGSLAPGYVVPTTPTPNWIQRRLGITPSPNCDVKLTTGWTPNTGQGPCPSKNLNAIGIGGAAYCYYKCTLCRFQAYYKVCVSSTGAISINAVGERKQCWDFEETVITHNALVGPFASFTCLTPIPFPPGSHGGPPADAPAPTDKQLFP